MIAHSASAAIDRPPARRRILGTPVDDVTREEALTRIAAMIASGRPHHVVTPNPEFVMRARRDPAFRRVLEAADLAPADGVGLRWAGRLLGQPLRAVVPGIDLVEGLAVPGAGLGQRWFLLGAAEGVAAAAGAALAERYPGLVIAGSFSGHPAAAYDDPLCRRIEQAAPLEVLLVAYGAPDQELWIARNQPRLGIPVAIGVGGAFNFLAGHSPRPPALVKRLQLIWLFRLMTEPWRWRRQAVLPPFAALVVREAVARRLRPAATP
jgi:N-acetylglucosaminyldiphosphoundecaprenol N-acetyl-beta-D-mannosaminyltransferase